MSRFLVLFGIAILMGWPFGVSAQIQTIPNGSFEQWTNGKPTNWSTVLASAISQHTTDSYSGSSSVRLTDDDASVSQTLMIQPGTYTFRVYVKGTGSARLWFSGAPTCRQLNPTTWTAITCTASLSGPTVQIYLYNDDARPTVNLLFDQVEITAFTPSPTHTPTNIATHTPIPPTATHTPDPTATDIPIPTATHTPNPTATDVPTPTATLTPPAATEVPATPTPFQHADRYRYYLPYIATGR